MDATDAGRWVIWLEMLRQVERAGECHVMDAASDAGAAGFRFALEELRRAGDVIRAMAPPEAQDRDGGGAVHDRRQRSMW